MGVRGIGVMVLFSMALFAGGAARAQIAVAPVVLPNDAVHRDVVGEIALELAAGHDMLTPQLTFESVRRCGDQVECIVRVAQGVNASHVVIVTAAPLGPRDQVVAARVYQVRGAKKLFEESAVLGTTRDLRADARAIGKRIAAVPGLPKRVEIEVKAPPTSPPVVEEESVGVMTYAGLGLLGGSLVAGTVTAVVSSLSLGGPAADGEPAATAIVAGSLTAGALAAGGIGLLAADAL